MPLINCEINHILTRSVNLDMSNAAANQDTTFAITDTKLYAPVVTLSAQDNGKLLQQLKSGFKHAINWNKYNPKAEPLNAPNSYLNFLISPSFHFLFYHLMLLIIEQGIQDVIFQPRK